MRHFLLALILILRCGATFADPEITKDKPSARSGDPEATRPPDGLVPDNILVIGNAAFHPPYIFIADKATRTLSIWSHDGDTPKLVDAFPMDIGKNSGDKVARDDAKTPEGIYFIQDRREMSKTNYDLYGLRAFTLDYPNFFDRFAGKSGSGIWLHAIPEYKSLLRGSKGCVVVRNEIIQKLTPMVAVRRTPVIILDKVNYVTPEELHRQGDAAKNWLEKWRSAWENKDLDHYMENYAENYQGVYKKLKMTKEQWRNYKGFLNKQYKTIHVGVKDPVIIARKDEAIIHFVQDYKSAGINDSGEKTLYVKRTADGNFQILTEIWGSLGHDILTKSNPLANEAAR
jgi:murein L,D-transpeptidase YafK